MRKRDNFYHKQKSGSNKDRCHFKQVKHLAQRKNKIADENYLADTFGVGCGDGFWGFFNLFKKIVGRIIRGYLHLKIKKIFCIVEMLKKQAC